ncbi:MAG: hypothetical protein K6T73_07840 [Candidatus Bathyarchaeota archaeon]|nr:hypothetical protein [Candidatus Bathyarchaeota archaeon]
MSETSVSIIDQLLQGISLVGRALTSGIQYVLGRVGLHVPDYAITVGTIILLILLIYRFGNVVNKIVLFALIFLLLSSLAGLLSPTLFS